MKQIAFQYSNDNGATWSTALVLDCREVDVYKITETEHKTAANKRKNETRVSYINADILTDWQQFDPGSTAAAEANWIAIQNFCAAKLRRIYNNDTTNWPTLDEYTTFNASNNTAYVNLLEMQAMKPKRMDRFGENTLKVREMKMFLQTRDKA